MRTYASPSRVATSCAAHTRLAAPERGAYLALLGIARRSTRDSLPDDDATLARWAGVDLPTWRRIKPAVMAFWVLAAGRWTPKRPHTARKIVGERAGSAPRAADAVSDAQPCPGAATPADLRALVRQHGAGAIAVLAAIMTDPAAPLGARLAAARALLERGYGKPPQKAEEEPRPPVTPITFRRVFYKPGPNGPVEVGSGA